jgi:multiple sugar transport system permease protein
VTVSQSALSTRATKVGHIKAVRTVQSVLLHIFAIGLGVIFIAPFVWMVSTSLKDVEQLYTQAPKLIPNPARFENYAQAWSSLPFLRYTLNTSFITVSCIVLEVISCGFVAFGFARMKFKLRDFWFGVLLASMMLPGSVKMIPMYVIWRNLDMLDTYVPLILPAAFGSAFYIFLLRQFLLGIPRELDDAARIDGCGYLQIWWHIMMPLTRTALITVAVFTFMGAWNDFFGPLIYLTSDAKKTLALGLRIFQGQYGSEDHLLMAASVIVLLPCLVVFMAAQRYFIRGIALSGLKG